MKPTNYKILSATGKDLGAAPLGGKLLLSSSPRPSPPTALEERERKSVARVVCLVLAASLFASPLRLLAEGEQQFDSPEAALAALTSAAQARDTNAMYAIFGPVGHELVSPDVVQASEGFNLFVKRLGEKSQLVRESNARETLDIGADGWPFPIPLVKDASGKWFFDSAAGREEILNRRIGADELGAMAVCHAYVDAQREYAGQDRNHDEVLEYAQHLMSTSGTHDGLYWPAHNPGDETSPLGPLIAQARDEGYHHRTGLLKDEPADEQTPYHGYYFRILTCQGKHPPGGRYNYVINGHMIAGFALIAWPAEYGNTGVMTFVVNQRGNVFQKDLGPKTASKAKRITSYDPDETWTLAEK
jgi:hypothetical protein